MRAVVQRVSSAKVTVNGEVVSSIGRGLCVFVGISRNDTEEDTKCMVKKLLSLKLFDDEDGKRWSYSLVDKGYEILCVSQFTLYATLKGTKPDFHHAMGVPNSKLYYDQFLDELKKKYNDSAVKGGAFGSFMQVEIVNEGPVTIEIESPVKKERESSTHK